LKHNLTIQEQMLHNHKSHFVAKHNLQQAQLPFMYVACIQIILHEGAKG
jgi:hypothetical protein